MWCCCVGDGHMCKDKHCWRGLVISKQHVSIINTCADTCQHECVLLYVHACTHVCVYIYTIIYIYAQIYIYSSPLLPFRRETLGAGDWKGEASKTDSVQTETPEDCKHSARPLMFSLSALELLIRCETSNPSTGAKNIWAISEPCALQLPEGEHNDSFEKRRPYNLHPSVSRSTQG